MNTDREDNPLALDVPDEVLRLRDAMDRASFDAPKIGALLNVRPSDVKRYAAGSAGKERIIALRRVTGDTPVNTLVRLFILGAAVDPEAARLALAPSSPEALMAAGLLEERDGGVGAVLQILPIENLLLAADPLWNDEIKPKHVVSVGGPSLDLAQITIRRQSRSTLDVGSGCGIQAFLAASHSDSVIGIDRNLRANNVASFNAQLNEMSHVSFVGGDLYAPVRDRRFDLIVANPPYVISPESKFIYRDSGLKGDEIAQRVIREGAALLEEGGYLQLTCEWAHLTGEDWRGRMATWMKGTGCDACVLKFTTVSSDVQAEMWLRSDPYVPAESLSERLSEWMAYHRAQKIEAISDGVITLRKRSGGNNWLRIDEAPQRIGPCGPSLERSFVAADFLAATYKDEALLGARLRLAPEVCWEQRLMPTPEGWDVRHSQLFVSSGLAYRGDADRRGLTLIGLCNGNRTVGEALEALAEANEPQLKTHETLGVVRQLVEQGFLLPAG